MKIFRFNKKQIKQPIPEWNRNWMEDAFRSMIKDFGEETIKQIKVLLPLQSDIPIQLPVSENNVYQLVQLIASQIGIDDRKIEILFIDKGVKVFNSETGYPIIAIPEKDETDFSGFYQGINSNGKFVIGIDIEQFKSIQLTIATIAHEMAHIVLSGIMQMKDYDEHFADLFTVYFGLGIFNANSALQFYKTAYSWGYHKQGYLTQQEWGYALALYASIRKETNPVWVTYLTKDIKQEFDKSQRFINEALSENWHLDEMTKLNEE